jgi:hypothetical protein
LNKIKSLLKALCRFVDDDDKITVNPKAERVEIEEVEIPHSFDPTKLKPEDKLSPNFTYEEMVASQTAARKGIDNTPSRRHVKDFVKLLNGVLEPLRKRYGKPVLITSGYRSPELNDAIGGSETSQHMRGQAADFRVHQESIQDVFEWIVLESDLKYDQIIWEYGRWIHVSYEESNNRNMILVASKTSDSVSYNVVGEDQVRRGDYL